MSPSTGYIVDVPYPSSYIPHLDPAMLEQVCLLNGVAPRDLSQVTWCDVGCGPGTTLNALAASRPESTFWGLDLNAEHIARAEQEARRGGLTNTRYRCLDLRALTDDDLPRDGDDDPSRLPRVDVIVMHGVWSWVSGEVRAAIERFIDRALRPGGLLYVSYNVTQGWSALAPMRDMMMMMTERVDAPSPQRVERGLNYLSFMRQSGALYFRRSAFASRHLDDMLGSDLRYLAHEYFNADWTPFDVREVAATLQPHDLHFVGSLPLYTNDVSLSTPTAAQPALAQRAARLEREAHRDLHTLRTFRRDVFIRGVPTLSGPWREALVETRLGAWLPRDALLASKNFPFRSLELSAEIFAPLADALTRSADTPAGLRDAHPPLADFTLDDVVGALRILMLCERVAPFAATVRARSEAPARLRVVHPFNQARLEHLGPVVVFASAVAGRGVGVAFLDALLIRVLCEHGRDAADDVITRAVVESLRRERRDLEGRPLDADADAPAPDLDALHARLVEACDHVRQHTLPALLRLGVLGAA